jgi:hypothetical protein
MYVRTGHLDTIHPVFAKAVFRGKFEMRNFLRIKP